MRSGVAVCLSAFLVASPALAAETVSGKPRVVTGDTVIVAGRVVGLQGIAAPGLKDACVDAKGRGYECGAEAARLLAQHLRNGSVTCEVRRVDEVGRSIALCRSGKEDIAAWMTAQGLAVADRRVTSPYLKDERLAWGKRRGLWAGAFDDPTRNKRQPVLLQKAVADVQTEPEKQ